MKKLSILLIFLALCACTKQANQNQEATTVTEEPAKSPKNESLYFEQAGNGEPIIFLHGVWMSSRFFKLQKEYFKDKYAYYALDFRGHGQSPDDGTGHTIPTYAEDLKKFIEDNNLKNVNLVGWSMGSFVIWEYLKNYGKDNIKTVTIVDQGAADFQHEGWDIAPLGFPALSHFMYLVQTTPRKAAEALVPVMFKDKLAPEALNEWVDECVKIAPASAAAILFNQSAVDYREQLSSFDVPALLIFGRDEKLLKVALGEYVHEKMPNSEFVIFENSGHCPFLEEADLFNKTLDDFIQKQ